MHLQSIYIWLFGINRLPNKGRIFGNFTTVESVIICRSFLDGHGHMGYYIPFIFHDLSFISDTYPAVLIASSDLRQPLVQPQSHILLGAMMWALYLSCLTPSALRNGQHKIYHLY